MAPSRVVPLLLLCTAILLAPGCATRPSAPASASATTGSHAMPAPASSAEFIELLRREHGLPALALVVVKEGRIVDRIATGFRKQGEPAAVTTHDLFHIGSCTKSMTATLAALLIEEGKLRWDTSIASVFPELKGRMDRAYEPVTVEQLMTHRAGCPAAPPPEAWKAAWEQKGTPMQQRQDFIQAVLAQPPQVPPGTGFLYSNQGYAVLGAMLERITGQGWEELLRERLFRPLGMKTAGFGVPGSPGGTDQPWGHTRILDSLVPHRTDNPPAIGPGGTVHCSLDDLARFVMLHLQRGSGPKPLLRPATFTRLHTPPPGGDYACGWVSLPRKWARGQALMHNGSNTLWYVVLWLAPERQFAVIAATNAAGEPAGKACDAAAARMIEQWLGR